MDFQGSVNLEFSDEKRSQCVSRRHALFIVLGMIAPMGYGRWTSCSLGAESSRWAVSGVGRRLSLGCRYNWVDSFTSYGEFAKGKGFMSQTYR